MKSKLIVDFGTNVIEIEVNWNDKQVTGINTDIAEDLFSSDKYDDYWSNGDHPVMTVESNDGQSSSVQFMETSGELLSNNPYVEL